MRGWRGRGRRQQRVRGQGRRLHRGSGSARPARSAQLAAGARCCWSRHGVDTCSLKTTVLLHSEPRLCFAPIPKGPATTQRDSAPGLRRARGMRRRAPAAPSPQTTPLPAGTRGGAPWQQPWIAGGADPLLGVVAGSRKLAATAAQNLAAAAPCKSGGAFPLVGDSCKNEKFEIRSFSTEGNERKA
jgi:hypothetical protein